MNTIVIVFRLDCVGVATHRFALVDDNGDAEEDAAEEEQPHGCLFARCVIVDLRDDWVSARVVGSWLTVARWARKGTTVRSFRDLGG